MSDPASAGQDEVKRSAWYRAGKKLRPLVNRCLARHSLVGDPPIFEPRLFPWTAALEAEWPAIRGELEQLLRQGTPIPALRDISPDHRRIAEAGWRSFFLWGYGYRIEEGCRLCPRTSRALAVVPGLNSAFFSILAPGAHIPRHTGVTKSIMTCHLGLMTPAARERCRIQVGERTATWQDGRCLVFDDTYPHEVWNDTEQTRAVLLIQFKRPLRLPGRLLGDLFLGAVRRSPFVQEARRNLAAWDAAHRLLDD